MTQPGRLTPDNPGSAQSAGPAEDARYAALGQLVEAAAVMEIALRMAFCVLIGSDYAAVVAGGQETHWLIENCDTVARHRADLMPPQQEAIRTALHACRDANRDRNRLVHDAWSTGPDGAPASLQGGQGSYQITGRTWTTPAIRAAGSAIAGAQRSLLIAVEDAFGARSVRVAGQQLAADIAERDL
jgi:hypothetical protein